MIRPVTFTESVTMADGTTHTGTCGETDAWELLRIAMARGYACEATRSGGVIITRKVWNASPVPRFHVVTLEPAASLPALTEVTRRDLAQIAARRAVLTSGRIRAGIYAIPPAATSRLISRGLVSVNGAAVSVSLAARLAMLAQDHRTTTSEPRGYIRPADANIPGLPATAGRAGSGGRAGKIYDGSSVASCPCGWSWPAEDRYWARDKARGHRQDAARVMLAGLLRERVTA